MKMVGAVESQAAFVAVLRAEDEDEGSGVTHRSLPGSTCTSVLLGHLPVLRLRGVARRGAIGPASPTV